MSEVKTGSAMVYPRLCLAYFLQFAIWGSWSIVLGGYGDEVLKLGGKIGILYTAIPLATIAALFINPLVDRLYSAQYVLALLHLIGGICLIICGTQTNFYVLVFFMVLYGICYMPSITLMNSIVLKHIPNSANAPYVFVFGTFGWIVVNLIIDVFGGGQTKPTFFFIGGGAALLLAVYALTLPNTPPNKVQPGEKPQGAFGALVLFKNPSFTIFAICALFASIPACGYFFPMLVPLLSQRGYPSPVSLGTLNQVSELLFMVALPFFVSKIGLKKCLFLGMAAWCLRYVFFIQPAFAFALLGLLVHGFCYSFLYAASYMYADKIAPDNMKSSVQGLIGFLLLGVGQVAGSLFYGYQVEVKEYQAPVQNMKVAAAADPVPLPPWSDPNLDDSAWKYLNFSKTVQDMLGMGDKDAAVAHLGVDVDADKDNTITWAELQAVGEEGLTYSDIKYTKEDLIGVFREVAKVKNPSVQDEQISVDLNADWLSAQSRVWSKMLVVPSIFCGVFALLFLVLGKDPKDDEPKKVEKTGEKNSQE